jgi:chromosome segregation ATPase
VFDHVIQRNERLSKAIGGDTCCENGDVTSITDKSPKSDSPESTEKKTDSKPDDLTKKSKAEVDKSDTPETEKAGSSKKSSSDSSDKKENKSKQSSPLTSLDDQVKDWNEKLVKENKNLHRLNTSLHEKNHFLSLKQAEFEELINAEQTKSEELQNKLDDLEYELTKSRMRNGKLENVLVDTQVNKIFELRHHSVLE